MDYDMPIWDVDDDGEDPLSFDAVSEVCQPVVKKEPLSLELVPNFIKREPVDDFVLQDNYASVPSSSSINDADILVIDDMNTFSEESDKMVRAGVLRSFTCKHCKKPYEMLCGSNLMIRGFCNDCLYNDKNNSKVNGNYKEKIERCTISQNYVNCEFCNEVFLEEEINNHLKLRKSCDVCDKIFCKLMDYKSHLFTHRNFSSLVENGACSDVTLSVGENKSSEVVDVSNDFVDNDDKNDELVYKKVSDKPKKEKHCRKLSNKTNKSDRLGLMASCGLCRKMISKELLEEHMREHNKICESLKASRSPISVKTEVTACVSLSTSESRNSVDHYTNSKSQYSKAVLPLCKYNFFCQPCKTECGNLISLRGHVESDKHVNMIVSIVGINLSCKQCNCNFNNIEDLKLHLIDIVHITNHHIGVSDGNIFCCKLCGKHFSNESDFQTHYFLKDHCKPDLKNNNCNINKLTAAVVVEPLNTEKSLRTNRKDNLKNPVAPANYKCKTCKKSFLHISSLKKHVSYFGHQSFINVTKRNAKCINSKMRISNHGRKNMKKEIFLGIKKMSSSNNTALQNDSAIENSSSHRNANKESGLFHCNVCTKSFRNQISLKKHKSMLKHFSSVPKTDSDQSFFDKPKQNCSEQSNVLECKSCAMKFENDGDFVYHMITQSHNGSFKINVTCVPCKASFKTLILYYRHSQRKTHIEECWKSSSDKKFCKLCNIRYHSYKEFEDHVTLRTHLGMYLKKFLSSKSNDTNDGIKVKKISENKVGELFTCQHCSLKFNSAVVLKCHMLCHTLSKDKLCRWCLICNKLYGSRKTLKAHLRRSHLNDKYSCPTCDQEFTSPFLVNLHLLKHKLSNL